MLNVVRGGSIIILLHDLADVPGYLVKSSVDTPFKVRFTVSFSFFLIEKGKKKKKVLHADGLFVAARGMGLPASLRFPIRDHHPDYCQQVPGHPRVAPEGWQLFALLHVHARHAPGDARPLVRTLHQDGPQLFEHREDRRHPTGTR